MNMNQLIEAFIGEYWATGPMKKRGDVDGIDADYEMSYDSLHFNSEHGSAELRRQDNGTFSMFGYNTTSVWKVTKEEVKEKFVRYAANELLLGEFSVFTKFVKFQKIEDLVNQPVINPRKRD